MRIRSTGKVLTLYRYAGVRDSKPLEARIGSMPINPWPRTVGRPNEAVSEHGIPLDLLKDLTGAEHLTLVEYLINLDRLNMRAQMTSVSGQLTALAEQVSSDIPDTEQAATLLRSVTLFVRSLKKARSKNLARAIDEERRTRVDIEIPMRLSGCEGGS
jgi:hypothetical protein